MYLFGDGFDLYASVNDFYNNYWDAGGFSSNWSTNNPGRFGGQSIGFSGHISSTPFLVKTSGHNDAVHHVTVAYNQNFGPSGTAGLAITFADNGSIQCSVLFRGDGAILLTSGDFGSGTVLATYTGAFSLINTWYAYEFEVVIHPTAGSFTVRTNGSLINSFQATGLNTRNGSANNYANQIRINTSASASGLQFFDDLLWRSDPTAVPWIGDIRCNTRMPATDVQKQFTSVGSRNVVFGSSYSVAIAANRAWYGQFIPIATGTISTAIFQSGPLTGNLKCALFADNAGQPGTLIQAATAPVTAPSSGATFTFSPAVTVTVGVQYWVAFCVSSTGGSAAGGLPATGYFSDATPYASWPPTTPVTLTSGSAQTIASTLVLVPAANAAFVNEPQQDALTIYHYDSNVGDNDLYGIPALLPQPVGVIAVTTRAFMQRADAGSRTAAVQVKSGGTVAQSPPITPNAASWSWVSRTDLVDPHTGVTWTRDAVDAIQVGPVLVS